MEDLLEFLFGASGRINRAKYWRSVLISIGAGLMTAVILFTAAGDVNCWRPRHHSGCRCAGPVVCFGMSPSPPSGCMTATKYVCLLWLVVFYVLPGALSHVARLTWFARGTLLSGHGAVHRHHRASAAFALTIWGFVEIRLLCSVLPAGARMPHGPAPLDAPA